MRTLINGENFFYGIHEKSCNENKIPIIVNVQISENGTFPFSFFRITKTRIRKFSVLCLTDPFSPVSSLYRYNVEHGQLPVDMMINPCVQSMRLQNDSEIFVSGALGLAIMSIWRTSFVPFESLCLLFLLSMECTPLFCFDLMQEKFFFKIFSMRIISWEVSYHISQSVACNAKITLAPVKFYFIILIEQLCSFVCNARFKHFQFIVLLTDQMVASWDHCIPAST